MDTDSLFLIFGYLKIPDKIVFGSVCLRWRFIYHCWLDLPLSVLLILYQREDLNFDEISKFGAISKKHQKVMNYLLHLNKSVKAQWISTHKKLCRNPNKQALTVQPKQLCNLISDLGIGVFINSVQQSIQLISVWGEELTFPIPTDYRYLYYYDCLHHHHKVENNRLIYHSLGRNDNIVTFVLDFSDLKNIQISWEPRYCCKEIFFKHHYFAIKDITIVTHYRKPNITYQINDIEKIYSIDSDINLFSFSGPYLVCFKNSTIQLHDMTKDFRIMTSSDIFAIDNCEPLFLKYYHQFNIIYIYCKREQHSFRLNLDPARWSFSITDVGKLNFINYFYEHNQHTNELEIIPKNNCSEQFYYNTQMNNFSFFATP